MCLAGLTLVAPLVAAAQTAGQFPAPTDETERALMPRIVAAANGENAGLAERDALLAKLVRPTALRGVVQIMRAQLLLDANRLSDARAAAKEGVRLYPTSVVGRIIAADVLTFAGDPRQAAQYWLDASVMDAEIARQSDNYNLDALVGRLNEAGLNDLADRVEERMGEIGLVDATLPSRSNRALARVRRAFEQRGASAALPAVSDLLDPADLLALYIDKSYEPVWPAISEWAGKDFVPVSRRYLEELRDEWSGRRDFETATNYARALSAVDQNEAVIDLFLPMLTPPDTQKLESAAAFLAPIMARSLSAMERGVEARSMLQRIKIALRHESEGIQLNISAALASQAYYAQNWAEADRLIVDWTIIANRLGPGVNRSPLLRMRAMHACALERLGRRNEAAALIADVIAARMTVRAAALMVYECTDDIAGAREFVIASLQDSGAGRAWALLLLQPTVPDTWSPQARVADEFVQKMRLEPAVRAVAAKFGRLLPYTVGEVSPPGFDPLPVNRNRSLPVISDSSGY